MATQVRWRGVSNVRSAMDVYADKVFNAIVQVGNYWAAVVETYAKQNAPWTDRSGNARQALHAFVVEVPAEQLVHLYLSHGVEYGLWLEIRWQGRYAIIWPTLRAHLAQIAEMLREIFG